MQFRSLREWGSVEPGTAIADSAGNQYIIGKQNDSGFLRLKNTSGGEDLAVEGMDAIDHNIFASFGETS